MQSQLAPQSAQQSAPQSTSHYKQNISAPGLPLWYQASQYSELRIPGLEKYRLFRHATLGDGSCMLHAILNAIYEPYRTGYLNGVAMTREELARDFRTSLSNKLTIITSNGKTVYDNLGGGNLASLGRDSPDQYSLAAIQRQLMSQQWLDEETLILIEYLLSKNIYVYDVTVNTFRSNDNLENHTKSVIIYFNGGHYEMVSLLCGTYPDITHETHLTSDSSIILAIRDIIKK
jgi:hypothetical protein